MSQIWHPQPKEVYQSWIDAIFTETSDELSDWETNFVASVNDFLNKRGTLTEKQANILERIYAEKTR